MPADSPRATADDRPASLDPFDETVDGEGATSADEPGAATRAGTGVSDEGLWPTPAHLTSDPPAGSGSTAGANGGNGDSGEAVGHADTGRSDAGRSDGGRDDGLIGPATPLTSDPWGPPSADPLPAPSPHPFVGPPTPGSTPVPTTLAPPTAPPGPGFQPPGGVAAPNGGVPSGDGGGPQIPAAIGELGTRIARRRDRHKAKIRKGLRVRQRLWTIDPWSVFKVSALFYMCMLLVLLTAATVLWNLGRSSGAIDSVEGFVSRMAAYGECVAEADVPAGEEGVEDEDCGEGELRVGGFKVDDGTIFKATLATGSVLAVAGSIGNVLMIVLLNLISEVTGGVRYTIVKEPAPSGPNGKRGSPRRRIKR